MDPKDNVTLNRSEDGGYRWTIVRNFVGQDEPVEDLIADLKAINEQMKEAFTPPKQSEVKGWA